MIALKIAGMVTASTIAVVGMLQAAIGAETLITGAEHTLGAGAFAGGLTWLALRDRVAKHDEEIRSINAKLETHGESLSGIQRDIGELVGEARARRNGDMRTRQSDSAYDRRHIP